MRRRNQNPPDALPAWLRFLILIAATTAVVWVGLELDRAYIAWQSSR